MNYSDYGVNISEADKLIEWLKKNIVPSSQVVEGIGGFSALFQANFSGMKEPCLAASTDGVGTKLKLAVHFQKYKALGQDLVAMCLNDLICSGASPLFFMDYYACAKLEQRSVREFLDGVIRACKESDCILLGGETAEMPDCYTNKNFDCAGFALGVVDKEKSLGSHKVEAGDRLIGINSSGFHSNGFSLLRKVFQQDLSQWEDQLLEPTALYVSLAKNIFHLPELKALAHITGGGLDNILRILPPYSRAELKPWLVPAPFMEVKKRTQMSWPDLLKTLNCGIGLIAIVSKDGQLEDIHQSIKASGFSAIDLGIVDKQKQKQPSWFLSFDRLASA